jgi:hypothetical protein
MTVAYIAFFGMPEGRDNSVYPSKDARIILKRI